MQVRQVVGTTSSVVHFVFDQKPDITQLVVVRSLTKADTRGKWRKNTSANFAGGRFFTATSALNARVSHCRIAAAPNPVRVGRPLLG